MGSCCDRALEGSGIYHAAFMRLAAIAGALQPADIGTKRFLCSRLKSLMALLGMFNTTAAALEGAQDPGGILGKKHHVLQIL